MRPSEFESTFGGGQRITRKPVGLVFVGNQKGLARLGLAISKKAVALASQRNRLKRVIRESFRQVATGLPAVDIVIYLQPGKATLTAPELRQTLTQLWAKVVERCASS